MPYPKADLILHPVRFRILQSLMDAELTTQQIADRLSNVPRSSIYRHLRLLLRGGMIAVADARLVHGIQEKRYRLAQPARLGPADVAGMSAADHLRYFTTYTLAAIRDFRDYLAAAAAAGGPDLLADRAGYTEITILASPAELDELQQRLQEAFAGLAQNEPALARRRHKFAIITHPLGKGPADEHGT